jgi:hypothetical protein
VPGGGDRGDQLTDPGGELVDLPVQRVNLVEQDPGELAVVGVERSGECFDEVVVSGPHASSGQPGQHAGIPFAADERLDHVPGGHGVQR